MEHPSAPVNAITAKADPRNLTSPSCRTAMRAITAPATAPPTTQAGRQSVMQESPKQAWPTVAIKSGIARAGPPATSPGTTARPAAPPAKESPSESASSGSVTAAVSGHGRPQARAAAPARMMNGASFVASRRRPSSYARRARASSVKVGSFASMLCSPGMTKSRQGALEAFAEGGASGSLPAGRCAQGLDVQRAERAGHCIDGGAQVILDRGLLRCGSGVGELDRRARLLPAAFTLAAQGAALPGGDAERPRQRVPLLVVLAGPREDAQQRGLRGVLAVRTADISTCERAKPRPEKGECSGERGAIAVREAPHQAPQLRAFAVFHPRRYLWLSGQSEHGKGQLSPHGSLHCKLFPAHASAGSASAAISAIHFSFISASSLQPRPARGHRSSRRGQAWP